MKGPVGIGKAVATVNGEKVAEAEITFAVGIE
jgi:3-hydroxyacyl-[acyl-carrier-protein] dehydratase